MPRFRHGLGPPLLPAQDAHRLGLSRKRSKSRWPGAAEVAGPLLLSLTLVGAALILAVLVLHPRRPPGGEANGAQRWDGAAAVVEEDDTSQPAELGQTNLDLKRELDALIEEATQVAREQGIVTETDAAEEEARRAVQQEQDWSQWLESFDHQGQRAAGLGAACTGQDCFPHGVCKAGQCRCSAAYTGKYCGHGVELSWPLLPAPMQNFSASFEGEFILHRGIISSQLKAQLATAWSRFDIEAVPLDGARLAAVRAVLPMGDTLFKGKSHESCAVVGPSGTLLLASGSDIDAHSLILRADTASVAGFEAHVGSRTDVRVMSSASWGFADAPGETGLLRTQSPAALEGLHWAAGQRPAPRLVASHPDFDAYVARSFDFAAGSALYAALLAVHTCQRVTLYGMLAPSNLSGLPSSYDDPCTGRTEAELENEQLQGQVVQALAQAELVSLGEPCAAACLQGASQCTTCLNDHKLSMPAPPNCDSTAPRPPAFKVPWL